MAENKDIWGGLDPEKLADQAVRAEAEKHHVEVTKPEGFADNEFAVRYTDDKDQEQDIVATRNPDRAGKDDEFDFWAPHKDPNTGKYTVKADIGNDILTLGINLYARDFYAKWYAEQKQSEAARQQGTQEQPDSLRQQYDDLKNTAETMKADNDRMAEQIKQARQQHASAHDPAVKNQNGQQNLSVDERLDRIERNQQIMMDQLNRIEENQRSFFDKIMQKVGAGLELLGSGLEKLGNKLDRVGDDLLITSGRIQAGFDRLTGQENFAEYPSRPLPQQQGAGSEDLYKRIAELEAEVARLRTENAKLKEQLEQQKQQGKDQPQPEPEKPQPEKKPAPDGKDQPQPEKPQPEQKPAPEPQPEVRNQDPQPEQKPAPKPRPSKPKKNQQAADSGDPDPKDPGKRYVLNPISGEKIPLADRALKNLDPSVVSRINEGKFFRSADLAVAISYARLKTNSNPLSVDNFRKLVADAGFIADYCISKDAVAIPCDVRKGGKNVDFYFSTKDIDFQKLQERVNPEAVQYLKTMLEGAKDINALNAERKSVKADMKEYLRQQKVTGKDATARLKSIYELGAKSINTFFRSIEKNPSEQYKNNRLTIGKDSAFVPLDEARKAEQKLQQKAAKQKSGGRTL